MNEIPKDIFVDVPSKCKECNHNTTKWLIEHDKKIRDEVIDEFANSLTCQACFANMQKDAIRIYAEQMKGEQNELL